MSRHLEHLEILLCFGIAKREVIFLRALWDEKKGEALTQLPEELPEDDGDELESDEGEDEDNSSRFADRQ